MATQYQHTSFILGYVIAIILILSNVKIVFANENNQYATTTTTTTTAAATSTAFANALEGTDDPVAVSSTQQLHTSTSSAYPVSELATLVRSVETKSISASHSAEFMQHKLHNTSSTIDEEPKQRRKIQQEVLHKQVERALSTTTSNSSSNDQQQQRQESVHGEDLVQQDENPKQLLSPMHSMSIQRDRQPNPNEKRHNHAHAIQQHNDHSTAPLSYHDKFMNGNEKTVNAIESNVGITVTPVSDGKMRNAQLNKHNQQLERISSSDSSDSNRRYSESADNNDDSHKTDEITAMPMKIVREHRANVNATSDAVFRVNESDGITKVNKTSAVGSGDLSANDMANPKHMADSDDDDNPFSLEDSPNQKFNERSRYLETDLDELADASFEQEDVNANDQLEWTDDANQFEELTLNEDDTYKSHTNMQARSWNKNVLSIESHESITKTPSIGTHNILKLTKTNKSKAIKRVAVASPPQMPQALLEIRLNKSPMMSTANERQFINSQSFRYITNLYDQYEWDADELRNILSPKCASDMDVYLDALNMGKIWAAKGNKSLNSSFSFSFSSITMLVKLMMSVSKS